MIRIGIIGACGRMGKTLIKEVLASKDAKLSGAVVRPGDKAVAKDLGELAGLEKAGIVATDSAEDLIKKSDAVIDFSSPAMTLQVAKLAAKYKKIHIIGTTGLDENQKKEFEKFAKDTVIIFSPNMSIGVNILMSLVEKAAKVLDDSYDIEIVEMHHNLKVDSPSGTALGLGRAAAKGRDVDLKDVERRTRDGLIGERKKGEIGFATLRGGDVVGDHTVVFAGLGERIEITHKASSRTIYAKGSVKACLWAVGKKPGLYSMQDVLGI